MRNGFIVLSEKDWEGMDEKQKLWAIYNTMSSMDTRLKILERRPVVDKCFSFLGGIVGGALAFLGIKYGGK
jgi:hypothetical protein